MNHRTGNFTGVATVLSGSSLSVHRVTSGEQIHGTNLLANVSLVMHSSKADEPIEVITHTTFLRQALAAVERAEARDDCL